MRRPTLPSALWTLKVWFVPSVYAIEEQITWRRNYIVFEDLLGFLPADQALAALKVLDHDSDGKISPCDVREAVTGIYNERTHLAATLSVRFLKATQRKAMRQCASFSTIECIWI